MDHVEDSSPYFHQSESYCERLHTDSVTADYKVLNKEDSSRHKHQNALIIQDRFTQWLQSYPVPSKSTSDTVKGFQRFLGSQIKHQHVYKDNCVAWPWYNSVTNANSAVSFLSSTRPRALAAKAGGTVAKHQRGSSHLT